MSSYNKLSNKLREIAFNCLKEEYFSTTKLSNGMNEYKLKMDTKDIEMFVNDFIDCILKDDELVTNLSTISEVSKEEVLNTLKQLKMLIDFEIISPELEISFISKNALITGLSKMNMNVRSKDFLLSYTLSGEEKKALYKSKEFIMTAKVSFEDNIFELSGLIKDNEAKLSVAVTETYNNNPYLNGNLDGVTYDSYTSMYKVPLSPSKTMTKDSRNLLVRLYTKDNKQFSKTSEIDFELIAKSDVTYSDGSNKEDEDGVKLSMVSSEGKALLKSSHITIKVNDGDQTSIIVETGDKKPMMSTNEVIFYSSEDEDEKFIIRADDKKSMSRSSSVSLVRSEYDKEEVGMTIKANDKKSLLKSKSYEVDLPIDDIVFKIEAKDKKPFNDSQNLYFYYKEGRNTFEFEFKNNSMKILSKEYQTQYTYSKQNELIKIPTRVTTVEVVITFKNTINFDKFIDIKNAINITESELRDKLESLLSEEVDDSILFLYF